MTTNQTIDGVPREAFKWAMDRLEDDGHAGCGYFDKLRALLDAPAVEDWRLERSELDSAGTKTLFHFTNAEGDTRSIEGVNEKHARLYLPKPAEQPQGEPVAWRSQCVHPRAGKQSGLFDKKYQAENWAAHWRDACGLESSFEPLFTAQPAPVAVVLPFADKVISKLRRFVECADDGQGADIGRHWFDILTHLGLLNRVQLSPGLWELTQQGEDCLDEVARLNTK